MLIFGRFGLPIGRAKGCKSATTQAEHLCFPHQKAGIFSSFFALIFLIYFSVCVSVCISSINHLIMIIICFKT